MPLEPAHQGVSGGESGRRRREVLYEGVPERRRHGAVRLGEAELGRVEAGGGLGLGREWWAEVGEEGEEWGEVVVGVGERSDVVWVAGVAVDGVELVGGGGGKEEVVAVA